MERYCKADVTLISKAVLEFRKMFIKFDVDPFRYVTLPSLCMAIYRGNFFTRCYNSSKWTKEKSINSIKGMVFIS